MTACWCYLHANSPYLCEAEGTSVSANTVTQRCRPVSLFIKAIRVKPHAKSFHLNCNSRKREG